MASFRRPCKSSGFLSALAIWNSGKQSVTHSVRKKDLPRHPSSTRSEAWATLPGTMALSVEHSMETQAKSVELSVGEQAGLRNYEFQKFMQVAFVAKPVLVLFRDFPNEFRCNFECNRLGNFCFQ